jgi:hypothetical protein
MWVEKPVDASEDEKLEISLHVHGREGMISDATTRSIDLGPDGLM